MSSTEDTSRRISQRIANRRAEGKEVSFTAEAFEFDDDELTESASQKSCSPWDDEISSPQRKRRKVNSENSESDQNDSFDDPVTFGRTANNCSRADSPPSKASSGTFDPYASISTVFSNVFDMGSFSKSDVVRISSLCCKATQASGDNLKLVVELLRKTLESAVTSETMNESSVTAICVLMAKVAVRTHLEMCDMPFRVVRGEIAGFNTCKLAIARQRICELISCLLSIDDQDSCIADLVEESEDDIDEENASENGYTLKPKICIPKLLVSEWANYLCDRRVDKEPLVRSSAVRAISMLPGSTLVDRDGKRMSINKCLLQSLQDISPDVRRSAVSAVSFSIKGNLSKFFDFVKSETNSNVRILMLTRLIKDVHLSSYKPQERAQLIRMIHQDSEATISSLLSTHLVPKWMDSSAQVAISSQDMPAFQFPCAFVSYLDCIADEDIAENLMKCAILNFLEKLPVRKNGIEIITFLRDSTIATDIPLLLSPVEVKNVLKSPPENVQHIFFVHYCFIEVLMKIHGERSESAVREDCLVRLLPNLTELSNQLKNFCHAVFKQNGDYAGELLVVKLICKLLRRLDLCTVGLKAWSECISFIAADVHIFTPLPLVEFTLIELLEEVRNRSTAAADQLAIIGEWACYSIGEIFSFEFGEDPPVPLVPGSIPSDSQYPLHRSAIILHSILSYPAFTELTTLMQSAFDRLVPLIHPIHDNGIRKVASRLIGLASTMNVTVFHNSVNMLRHTLQLDFHDVKAVALLSLVEVAVVRGFRETAKFCFPEIEEAERTDNLAKLFETTVLDIDEVYLPDIVQPCLRLIHVGQVNWPRLIGLMLIRTFPKTVSSDATQAQKYLSSFFCHVANMGPTGRMQLLSGFLNSLGQLEELEDASVKLGQMSSFFLTYFMDVKVDDTGSEINVKKSATNATVTYCYLREVLRHVIKYPDGVCSSGLITYTLVGFDFNKVTDAQFQRLILLIDCARQKLEAMESNFVRNMKKFIHCVNNAAKERGIEISLKPLKRKNAVKIEGEPIEGSCREVKEEPSSPSAKKRRSAHSTPIYDIESGSDDPDIFEDDADYSSSSRTKKGQSFKRKVSKKPTIDPEIVELSSDSEEELSSCITIDPIDIDSRSDGPTSEDIFSGQ